MGIGGGEGGQMGGEKQGIETEPEGDLDVSPELFEGEPAGDASGSDRLAELEHEVTVLRAELAEAKAEAERAGRRAAIEQALVGAGAIDLEITTPLVERVVAGMETPDVAKAVREVRAGKSFLFRPRSGGGVMSEAMAGEAGKQSNGLIELAGDARVSGDRSDLLRYLRARRQ